MSKLIEKEVSITGDEVALAGTLCLPSQSRPEGDGFPTVLWLHGSGPIDRDDNIPGQELNNSKAIAHHLAEFGIASLRYDKRGVGQSTGEYLSAGHSDFVNDALASIWYLDSCEECDSNYLFAIGHSEGSMIAPQLSQRFEKLAGIILLCPTIESPESMLMRQAHELKNMVKHLSGFRRPVAKLFWTMFDPVKGQRKAILKMKNSHAKVGKLGISKQPFHWFRQFMNLDLEHIYKNTHCPTLAIAGSKDFQVVAADAEKIGSVISGRYEWHIVKDMSHLLRNEPGSASVFNYSAQLKQPIQPRVLELILSWLKKETI